MTVTIRDVARRVGISVATVSRVLSGSSHPVTPELRQRVLDAVREMNYTPNGFARGLSMRDFRLIGLVIPDVRDPYFMEVARGIEDTASRHGYMVVLCNTDWDPVKERKCIQEMRAMRAAMILPGAPVYRDSHLRDLANHPAPVVVVGRRASPCASVLIDNIQGAFEATSHLIDLGHRRIACISGHLTSATSVDRLEGFRLAMTQRGLSADESMALECDYTLEGGAMAMRLLLQGGQPPSAVFAANDILAIGAMGEAQHSGLRVPEELAVVGFNDVAMAVRVHPTLTTIHLPLYQMGETAVELLLSQVGSRGKEAPSVTVTGELVVRGSTVGQVPVDKGGTKRTHDLEGKDNGRTGGPGVIESPVS